MKIQFEFNEKMRILQLKQVNIIAGGSNTGKTTLLNTIADVFKGTTEGFLDNQVIDKKEYKVKIVSSNQNIDDELKFTSKTELYTKTKEIISEIDHDEINEMFNSIKESLLPVEELLKQELLLTSSEFQFNDLLSFIKTHFSFIDIENDSISLKKYLLISDVILKTVNKSKTILLIDDFDAFFDLEQMINIIETVKRDKNIVLFVFVRTPNICKVYFEEFPTFVINNELRKLKMITKEFSKNYIDYNASQMSFMLITEKESYYNYINTVSVYFNELFYMLINKDKQKLFDIFKKNQLFNQKDLVIIEKFKNYLSNNS